MESREAEPWEVYYLFIAMIFAVTKYLTRSNLRDGLFPSQFEGAVHDGGEVLAAGV